MQNYYYIDLLLLGNLVFSDQPIICMMLVCLAKHRISRNVILHGRVT